MQCSIENNLEITKLGFTIFVLHENEPADVIDHCPTFVNKINIVGNFNYLD